MGHAGSNAGTDNAAWGSSNTIASDDVDAATTPTTVPVDGVDARTTFKAGDVVYKSDRTLFGVVQSVDSATQLTLSSVDSAISDDDELYNFGQKATSGTQKSKALTTNKDLVPVVGIEAGDTNAAILYLHYMKINRTISDG